jgi:hypothetical protein
LNTTAPYRPFAMQNDVDGQDTSDKLGSAPTCVGVLQELPLNVTASPIVHGPEYLVLGHAVSPTATHAENDEHETSLSWVTPTAVGAVHEPPLNVTASPPLSTAAQNEDEVHDTASWP